MGRKIFPPGPHFFILPISEKNGEEKVLNDVLYTNTLTLFILFNECKFADHVFATHIFVPQLPS